MKDSKRLVRAVSLGIAIIMVLTMFSGVVFQIAYMI